MLKNRTAHTTFPVPSFNLIQVLPESHYTGRYVFGQSTFEVNPAIKRPFLLLRILGGPSLESFILGLLSNLMIVMLTKLILTALSSKRSDIANSENEYAYAAVRVNEFLQGSNRCAWRQDGWPRGLEKGTRFRLTIMAAVIALLVLVAEIGTICLMEPRMSLSKPGDYNLKATHPISANLEGEKLLKTVWERPCITPVFSKSNPSRNFSLSACITFDLERAHTHVNDTVHTVKIGSWFHKAGGDHIITFGNATIRIRTRLFLYGAAGGTWRVLFSMLYHDHLPAIRYLHELVMYGIMEESCNAAHATRTCDQILKEYGSAFKPTNRTIILWTARNGRRKETVLGLETSLFAKIKNPWETIHKRIGPLLSAEQVDEVEGPASYSHIGTEQLEKNLDGLLVKEYKIAGMIGLLLVDACILLILIWAKLLCSPEFLSHTAWKFFEECTQSVETQTTSEKILLKLDRCRSCKAFFCKRTYDSQSRSSLYDLITMLKRQRECQI